MRPVARAQPDQRRYRLRGGIAVGDLVDLRDRQVRRLAATSSRECVQRPSGGTPRIPRCALRGTPIHGLALEQSPGDAERQEPVRPGPKLVNAVGLLCGGGGDRIDDQERGAPLAGLADERRPVQVGHREVLAPDHHGPAVREILRRVRVVAAEVGGLRRSERLDAQTAPAQRHAAELRPEQLRQDLGDPAAHAGVVGPPGWIAAPRCPGAAPASRRRDRAPDPRRAAPTRRAVRRSG